MSTTSIIDWIFILIKDIFCQKRTSFLKIVLMNILHGFFAIFISGLIDTIYFGELTYTGFNFLKFNVLQSGSEKYGVSGPFFYIVQILYFKLFNIFALGYGLKIYFKRQGTNCDLFLLIFTKVFILSLLPHKETRFIISIVGPLVIITSMYYD